MFLPLLSSSLVALGSLFLPGNDALHPLWAGPIVGSSQGDEVAKLVAEESHCWGHASGLLGRVAVLEDGAGEAVIVKFAMDVSVITKQPFHRLHPDLCPLVSMRISHRCESVVDAVVLEEFLSLPGCEFWATIGG